MTSRDIRQSFLDFFAEKKHVIVPGAPVIPHGDPTLLFTNAGMNQFKDVFLGKGVRSYSRCADTQKCIRVSGKHNDLDEVGYDTYHHTLFEMLGNWSFGDYYKTEAIAWAWELLVDRWKLDPSRLHATVYRTDDEAHTIWTEYLPVDRIHYFDEKDNFWEMGEVGPCGPCSEIHYDRTPDKSGGPLVNAGVPEVMEIWNLVFIQFNRKPDGSLEPLANKYVDTGMGFERICAVIQQQYSNYDTDVFTPIISKIELLTGRQYSKDISDKNGIAMRVVADHIRTLAFAIADGAAPSNDGRGYVLRRILRRAARYARNLGADKPMLYLLIQTIVDTMGEVFPEIATQQEIVEKIIKSEEESFLQTLDRGLELFDAMEQKLRTDNIDIVPGDQAFLLYDTFGFPLDLTELLSRERGLTVDIAEFRRLLDEQRARSRSAQKKVVQEAEIPEMTLSSEFVGWENLESDAKILYVSANSIVLDKTPFYTEMGGQISDVGNIVVGGESYETLDVKKSGNAIIHFCDSEITAAVGDAAIATVDRNRRWDVQRNHTATHVLHEALRQIVGNHVQQAGSLVAADHLRFDFSSHQKLDVRQLLDVEEMVNGKIRERIGVETVELSVDKARKIPGVKMFFGDKYGDSVRVVFVDPSFSVEFCGGTHVKNTSEIGFFKIIQETSIASGVRRIEAITSSGIMSYIHNLQTKIELEQSNNEQTLERLRQAEKELSKFRIAEISKNIPDYVFRARISNNVRIVAETIDANVDMEQLQSLGDILRSLLKNSGVGLLASVQDDGKVFMACVVSDDLTSQYQAGKLIGALAKKMGGGGGGKAHMATAGAKNAEFLPVAIEEFIAQF